METDKRTEPLREWNKLTRENTENAMVSSMFSAALRTTSSIDLFSSWMLVATAAVASFLLINATDLIEFIGKEGIITGGYILCGSCIFGLLAKIFGLHCKLALELSDAINKTFLEHLKRYEIEEEKIQEGASFWGITLETGVRIDRILTEYLSAFPRPVRWLASRHYKKHKGNPQAGYLTQLKSLMFQGLTTFIQAVLFIYFFGQVFVSAAKI